MLVLVKRLKSPIRDLIGLYRDLWGFIWKLTWKLTWIYRGGIIGNSFRSTSLIQAAGKPVSMPKSKQSNNYGRAPQPISNKELI